MSEPAVTTRIRDGIAVLGLNRPEVGNAIDLRLAADLAAAVAKCVADTTVRCVVLTGHGRMFCVGGDIGSFGTNMGDLSGYLMTLASSFHTAQQALLALNVPVISMVNGPAAGAGMGLALCCDLVVASETAHFSAGYTSIGLTPDGGLTWLLPRLIGLRRAQEMIMLNRRITAAESECLGMVSRVVPADQLKTETDLLAHQMTDAAVGACARIRGLIEAGASSALDVHLRTEAGSIATSGGLAEAATGIAAFLGNRKPVFNSDA